MIQSKILSSMDKCFLDDAIAAHSSVKSISMLRNQQLSLQLAYTESDNVSGACHHHRVKMRVLGELAPYVRVRRVENVPVTLPVYPTRHDDNYLRTTPGLYPDVLMPLSYHDSLVVSANHLRAVWLDFEPKGALPAGDYETVIELYENTPEGEHIHTTQSVNIHIVGADLPENELYVTQWFHCDCLAQYYGVEALSERHWEIIENFARTAVANGINLLLTPIFTPALDTYVGGERLTVQLVGITRDGDAYAFDFTLLDRWIEMCNRVGIKYFEIAHLFTQWGAAHAPKIMATVDGEHRRIFGWDTDASGAEYVSFLRLLIPKLRAQLDKCGYRGHYFFHISDEPTEEHFEQYTKAKAGIIDLIEDCPVRDALSHVDFYNRGIITSPIPATNHAEDFLAAKVPDLWVYYCCVQHRDVSNQFVAMPGYRTRVIGAQLFKYGIKGFLQWGYNFYFNRYSMDKTNPFFNLEGDLFTPAGDCFLVYPGEDGQPLHSLRELIFEQALLDVRAMQAAAKKVGRAAVLAAIDAEGEINFKDYPRSEDYLLRLREAVNRMAAE